jgi:hypothetical protein
MMSHSTSPSSGHDDEYLDLLRRGEKIEAIKLYRERTGAGLKEAKDAVEALGARHGIQPQPLDGPGCLMVIAVLLAMAVVAAIVVIIMR